MCGGWGGGGSVGEDVTSEEQAYRARLNAGFIIARIDFNCLFAF